MWWIIGIVAAVVVAVIVVVAKASCRGCSGGGDIIECPHCNRSIQEPPRRRTGADIELYDFPCPKCGETIYVKVGS